ncbi:unnamed protein product [Tilletia laevis]|uniref:Peptidase S8/S53 domain-containing protein n=1 Tax=Tilletia laevis TaxID=157183 RepID=A0A9N8LG80_9BASI|nr:unnamed protein product [Tilletia laevis]
MKLVLAFVALLQLADVVTSQRHGKASNAGPTALGAKNAPPVVPRGYLVEFVSDSTRKNAESSGFTKHEDRTQHDALHSFLTKRKSPVKYRTRFTFTDSRIFSGMSLILDNDKDVGELQAFPGVKKVHPLRIYMPAAFEPTIVTPEFVQSAVNGGGLTRSSASRVASDSVLKNDTFEPHVMTGVDKLHAQGYYGKGQTIGILDTGIDYTHPALNGGKPAGTPCFDHGCPVSGGYDFVGDKYVVGLDPIPDPDPFADCPGSGHGTHVAGTIIALDREVGFTGFFDGVDVLSLSLGGPYGWVEDPSSAVASKIVALGTPVIVSHGNDGGYGAFYASGPASGLGVTGVGSVDNEMLTGYSAKLTPSAGAPSNGNGDLVYLVGTPFTFNSTQSKKLKLYATSTDPTVMDDGCAPLPSSTPDLKDYVVVIARGTCTFVTKFTNAYNAGARYVFIYNSVASIMYLPAANQTDLQAAMLTRPDGLYIVNALAAGKELYIDFTTQSVTGVPDTGNGGFMSSFSTVLSSTAKPLGFSTNVSTLETTARQGGRLVNVYAAVKSVSRVSPGSLDLNDTQYFDGAQTLNITNVGTMEQTYTLSHLPGGSIASIDPSDKAVYVPGPIKPTANAASVTFSSETVTILPGKSQEVSMTFKAPGLDTSALPIYSGFISIESSNSSGSMRVPYSGPDGKTVITDDQRVYSLESSESQPTLVWRLLTGTSFYSIDLVDGNTTFVPTIPTGSASSRRSLAAEHKHVGVRRLSGMDLAHSLHAEQHRRLSSDDAGLALQRVAGTSGSFNDVKIIGNLKSNSYRPRNNIYGTSAKSNLFNQCNLTGNYTDTDGVDHQIQNGTYRILLRARRLLATDAKAESSYESYLTHAFTVKRV